MADIGNNLIQKFDSNRNFITKWGSLDSGDGQFNPTSGITVGTGDVFVADQDNNRIQRFDSDGGFITKSSTNGIPIGIGQQ